MKQLKNCPFCGGEPELQMIGNNVTRRRSVRIVCTDCNTKQETGAMRFDHEWCKGVAIEAWNKRVDNK